MKKAFTLFELMIVIVVILVIAAIAIPNLSSHHHPSSESSAIGSLRSVTTAQSIYFERYKAYGTLEQLGAANLIDPVLASGTKLRYRFALTPATTPAQTYTYTATANPVSINVGNRYFFVDQSGVIRFSSSAPANSSSFVIGGNK